jgi:hypothetical protein
LLKEIEPAHGANQNISAASDTKVTRTAVAQDAGLSERQQKTFYKKLKKVLIMNNRARQDVESRRASKDKNITEGGDPKVYPLPVFVAFCESVKV